MVKIVFFKSFDHNILDAEGILLIDSLVSINNSILMFMFNGYLKDHLKILKIRGVES